MAELEHDELPAAQQTLVREFLSARLDPQLGRAEARFREMLARPAPPVGIPQSRFHFPPRLNSWALGLVGAALAASLAALWAGPSLHPVMPAAQNSPAPVNATPVNNNVIVEQDVHSQTFDDGTWIGDGDQPFRVLRRRDIERTRWFDQNEKLQGEQTVPQDHVIYVPMKTY